MALSTPSLASLVGQQFDLLIIGGGIIGCGIARDAAMRGLLVALFERDDFGCGTTSRSTRLIHGGLRYLEMLDFRLVRQDLRERETLLRIAPHCVRPLPFLIPFYERSVFNRLKIRAGMLLYDLLSYSKSLPKHRILNRAETLVVEPGLLPDGLHGAAMFYDTQCALPERLCVFNALDAESHGAFLLNHADVTGLIRGSNGRIEGLCVKDTLSGEEGEARGGLIVNATGPWLDQFLRQSGDAQSQRLRLTKGIHFAAPAASRNALALESKRDSRLIFVIPWQGQSLVGTTDTDFDGDPADATANPKEITYLRETADAILPGADFETVHFTCAGVRALACEGNPSTPESRVSRMHKLVTHNRAQGLEGMISVLGGKITAYRSIAEEVVNCVLSESPDLSCRAATCSTASRPLRGGDLGDFDAALLRSQEEAAIFGLDPEQADVLFRLYGSGYGEILNRIRDDSLFGARLAPEYPDVRAQVIHAVEREHARTASDYLMRRSGLFFRADQGRTAVEPVVREMARLLGWSEGRQAQEVADYESQVALTQSFR